MAIPVAVDFSAEFGTQWFDRMSMVSCTHRSIVFHGAFLRSIFPFPQ